MDGMQKAIKELVRAKREIEQMVSGHPD